MGEPDADEVLVERSGGVAALTLNRPRRRNALTVASVRELTGAVTAALGDPDVGAVLLRGADHCFCSGIDLRAADTAADGALDPAWSGRFHDAWLGLHRTLAAADKPVVAALERAAVNAGAALALSADLLVAGRTAFLQIAEVERDMVARINLAWLVAKYGSGRALDLTLTGRRADGDELYRLGMAHACVEDDAVLHTAGELATRLAGLPRTGVAQTKRLVRALERDHAPGVSLDLASGADLGGAR
ncbi:MAG TPA: enoyl-CoA hydratase/isomerase family protein [Streptosporangiaceae bacterium]|jgi:enoyl-CoA hydratase/carnithine racemase